MDEFWNVLLLGFVLVLINVSNDGFTVHKIDVCGQQSCFLTHNYVTYDILNIISIVRTYVNEITNWESISKMVTHRPQLYFKIKYLNLIATIYQHKVSSKVLTPKINRNFGNLRPIIRIPSIFSLLDLILMESFCYRDPFVFLGISFKRWKLTVTI